MCTAREFLESSGRKASILQFRDVYDARLLATTVYLLCENCPSFEHRIATSARSSARIALNAFPELRD